MQTQTFRPPPDTAPIGAQARPKVIIAYEDFDTAVKARNLARHLLGVVPEGSCTAFWKFDLLNYPALSEQAVAEARQAEFIVLSMHGECDLPGEVIAWMESVTSKPTQSQAALIALLDESAENSATCRKTLSNLRKLASRAELLALSIFSDTGETEACLPGLQARRSG